MKRLLNFCIIILSLSQAARAGSILEPLTCWSLPPRLSSQPVPTLQLKDVVTPPVLILPKPSLFTFTSDSSWDVLATLSVEFITFCTDKGDITLSLKDGSVKLPKDLKPDAAAREFWKAVTKAFPEVRKAIKEGKQ